MSLVDFLIEEGWLKSRRIIEAFREINRADFMPEDIKNLAEVNEALPIGYSQTISQPLVVAFMLEQLQPRGGEKILDVGSGSGWTTALLAHIVSQEENYKTKGRVIAIELVPELKDFGEKNVTKYDFIKQGVVKFVQGDGSKGYEKEKPFDKILCSAAAQKEIPQSWREQLKVGGRIITPISSSIWLFIKKSEKGFEEIEYPGFAFVPLIEK